MASVLMLVFLCVTMLIGSLASGIVPLTLSLSEAKMRHITVLGAGLLIGTALAVIIPEGIHTLYSSNSNNNRAQSVAHSVEHEHGRELENQQHEHEHGYVHAKREALDSMRMLLEDETAPAAFLQRLATRGPRVVNKRDINGMDLNEADKQKALKELKIINSKTELENNRAARINLNPPSSGGSGLDVSSLKSSSSPERSERPSNEFKFHSHSHTHSGSGSSSHSSSIGITLVLGFVFMMIVDQIGGKVAHSHSHSHNHNVIDAQLAQSKVTFTTTLGLVVHSAADGIALGAAASTSQANIEMIVFLAIMLHKAPASFGLVTFLLHAGLDRAKVRKHLIIFALAAPLAALLTYAVLKSQSSPDLGADSTGLCMLFSAGTFLYVSTVHVLPEVQAHNEDKQFKFTEMVAFIFGSVMPIFLSVGHSH